MSERTRISLPVTPWHIIQRGNNRSACFAVMGTEDLSATAPALLNYLRLCRQITINISILLKNIPTIFILHAGVVQW
jgi:REP element-mobilizing transposase RayT